ncbi:MAG: DUF4412 domain-containing protein [Bacteroidia bacterium]|nr:DUF4412 domain-containing protein [Bacteroidia bacterium]
MNITKKAFFTLALGTFFAQSSYSQGFEGVMDFRKYSPTDTVHYKYYIKDGNVRIEEINRKGELSGIMLVLPKINSVRALNPDRKMYMDVPNNNAPVFKGEPEITKTKLTKDINGIKCTQWRIKSAEEKTEATYWVAKGDYDFFIPMLKTLNRKDKLSYYFLSIPENQGLFPFEGEERSVTRELKNSVKVDQIAKKKLDNKIFSIPADYKKYEK